LGGFAGVSPNVVIVGTDALLLNTRLLLFLVLLLLFKLLLFVLHLVFIVIVMLLLLLLLSILLLAAGGGFTAGGVTTDDELVSGKLTLLFAKKHVFGLVGVCGFSTAGLSTTVGEASGFGTVVGVAPVVVGDTCDGNGYCKPLIDEIDEVGLL
jgi:hypothetical protein